MAGLENITGTVENIIFANGEASFCVFKINPQDGAAITVTVNSAPPLVGELVEISGAWTEHKRFGRQFRGDSIRRVAPTTSAGIERFLASGAVKGVKAALAKRLVAAFGEDTLEIIAKNPDRLLTVSGIGKKKMAEIHESYSEQSELREIMLFLEMRGVSGAFAAKIYAQYASFSLDVIRENPYRLAREVDGIGFRTADQIAMAMGLEEDSFERLWAGIDFTLLQQAAAGNCCVPEITLAKQTAKLIKSDFSKVHEALQQLLKKEAFYRELADHGDLGDFVYPRALYFAEKNAAERLIFLKKQAAELNFAAACDSVSAWEQNAGFTLAETQRKAIYGALENGVFILTGGPGTGKTTVIRGIIEAMEAQGLRLILGAPTGRAAKRLAEASGRRAATVHRLLEAQGGTGGAPCFEKNADNPLEADAIIIDEVSMMDITLLAYLLDAVPKGCRVIFVGDADQLPAVGPGAVLNDMLLSKAIPAVRLTEVFRQAGESSIVMNAHAINQGRMPSFTGGDFLFFEMEEHEAAEKIAELCCRDLVEDGYDVKNDVQVLSPMHRMECGVSNLNQKLQEALNPKSVEKAEVKSGGSVFRLGDKVMQLRNNYQKNVFNGDIGFICAVNGGGVVVSYPESYVEYDAAELAELKLAYAMSVHKSQGSEYKVVIMPLVSSHYIMLQRNLLYTAVTRAKEKVILIGSRKALDTAVGNDKTKKRYTRLKERLGKSEAGEW